MKREISVTVNGKTYRKSNEDERTLLSFLRDEIGLTGTKEGCSEGTCGACSVLVDGKLVNSCSFLAVEADGKKILTVEGLNRKDGTDHPVQKAFIEAGAVQCGFCIPGMIMATVALYLRNQDPEEKDIRKALSGNLCRCTGYVKILDAVRMVGKDLSWLPEVRSLCS